jgi:hypothetical protein
VLDRAAARHQMGRAARGGLSFDERLRRSVVSHRECLEKGMPPF